MACDLSSVRMCSFLPKAVANFAEHGSRMAPRLVQGTSCSAPAVARLMPQFSPPTVYKLLNNKSAFEGDKLHLLLTSHVHSCPRWAPCIAVSQYFHSNRDLRQMHNSAKLFDWRQGELLGAKGRPKKLNRRGQPVDAVAASVSTLEASTRLEEKVGLVFQGWESCCSAFLELLHLYLKGILLGRECRPSLFYCLKHPGQNRTGQTSKHGDSSCRV
jgi:hypothetical protein